MSRGSGYGTVREYRDDPDDYGYNQGGQANFQKSLEDVSNKVFQINSNATALERILRQIGTRNDSTDLRHKIHDTEQKTNLLVADTTKVFKQLAKIKVPDKQLKLQVEKLKGDFQETVSRYSRLQRDVAEKVKAVPLQSQRATPQGPSDLIGWQDDDDQVNLIAEEKRRGDLQLQDDLIETDLAVIQEREEQVRQLEGDILNVNEIFKDLSALVYEQGEVVDSIEANVERAHDNVESGNQQLHQASKYASSYRKKLCYCGIFLAIIVAIVIIIIVVEVEKNKKK
ncbi:syntaxin-7-like [Lineus longissimus]|uniref:syntaxin-7-like n=1 Tax=Lineus longissimus TaxID=88925 RepID=UPI002B4FB404